MTGQRTRQQERARYNGMTPREFGEAIGRSSEFVYDLIRGGWFGWTKNERGTAVPECMDVRARGAERPQYIIHASAASRWYRERAVTEPRAA